ncbi:MAG: GPW/gp25 family protein [Waterburya sp.]
MQKAYIGQGLKFPIELVKGKAELVNSDLLIQQSITDILNTPIGTRIFLREFGFRGNELLFEQNDEVLQDLLRYFIGEAIELWETRVKYVDTEFENVNNDRLDCIIKYKNIKSNEIKSFVYPFYKKLKN